MKYANVYELLSGKPIETVEVKEDAELTNVMQYLNQKYNSDDAVIRVETTAANSITDPLNVIVGARFQLEARIAKIVRSVLKEGVLQPPPRMTKQIQDWTERVYYGHIWSIAEDALKETRVDQDIELKEVMASLNKWAQEVRDLLKIESSESFTAHTIFMIANQEYRVVFTLFTGLKKERRYSIEQKVVIKGKMFHTGEHFGGTDLSRIEDQIESVISDFVYKVELGHKKKTPEEIDHEMVELTRIVDECKKYAEKPKFYKSRTKQNFPVTVEGWKYLDSMPAEVADQLEASMSKFVLPVVLDFSTDGRDGATYMHYSSRETGEIIAGKSYLDISVHVPKPLTYSGVIERIGQVKAFIRHEMQHYAQYELGILHSKMPKSFGRVDKRIGNPDMGVSAKSKKIDREYYLSDQEFQTQLTDSIDQFASNYRRYLKPGVTAKDVFNLFVMGKTQPYRYLSNKFFWYIYQHNKEKWRNAVRTASAELHKLGVL